MGKKEKPFRCGDIVRLKPKKEIEVPFIDHFRKGRPRTRGKVRGTFEVQGVSFVWVLWNEDKNDQQPYPVWALKLLSRPGAKS